MKTTIDLNAVLETLHPLSDSDKRWLADRLYEEMGLMSRGHAYVDMGLSVRWATCNVGAYSPEECGNYYAWGETKSKPSYDEDNCETWEKEIDDIGGTSRDVAHVRWGGGWRMPTWAESYELYSEKNCTWEWIGDDCHGYRVTSKKTGNSIFIPNSGWRNGESVWCDIFQPMHANYWTSTPGLDHQSAYSRMNLRSRRFGLPVRPVLE